jgi:hypothetical protein
MPRYDAFMKIETVDGEPKADDRFAIDWANEVALGGPDAAPDNGGFVVESDAPVSASSSDDGAGELHMVFCDGSIRLVGTSDAIATSDFFLV